jgi:hypothetical protein
MKLIIIGALFWVCGYCVTITAPRDHVLSVSIPNEVTSVDCPCGPEPVSDMDRSLVIGIQVRATCLAVCHQPLL